ncbi:MAG TPA: branched-chain amino acid ABC transporter permease [Spirochaetota bacterium]|jgi:branched-chain amino acid transport system permease protein|nr:branched-chain amino acid ABC transporter permease [Spirochaetota bacterium]HOK93504.1 branched-chain amino acid ABC transporter permease [Spirochaetota bacterium]HOQ11660.1 branched-chain amino acid ABC transporter permease [Spirochaetota bacterium]HPP96080.1 branched-chain amino acid ABC transporter permease [Spirochaetota bacterium]HRS63944.1 branched-chain amino acid ABC transporter permease [Spirochaetota bacterium]
MNIESFFQHFSNAVSLGSLYALIAIGYTMVYGILRLINFAHGDIFMLGAYFAFYCLTLFMMPWWVGFIVAIGLTACFGILIERVAYKPLRNSPKVSVLISAIGVSFLLESLGVVIFGGIQKAFPIPDIFGKVVVIAGISIVSVNFFIPIIAIICLIALMYLVNYTKTGMAMRALSKDHEAARLMAIDVDRVISYTFGLGSILAAVGGIMWGMKYPQLYPLMGLMPGLKCFIAAVVGGIGNIAGAVVGGFVIGFIEIMTVAFVPELSGYRDAFAFILLIIILLVKPNGIMGEKLAEKV